MQNVEMLGHLLGGTSGKSGIEKKKIVVFIKFLQCNQSSFQQSNAFVHHYQKMVLLRCCLVMFIVNYFCLQKIIHVYVYF